MTELTINTEAQMLWEPPKGISANKAGEVVRSFLDVATTSFGRATHYNTREEQQAAELAAHAGIFEIDRDLYTAMLTLPGVTDRAMQIGTKMLLSTQRNGVVGFLTPALEREVIYHLIQGLPAQRMMKLLDAFRFGSEQLGVKRANNARTRKLVLRTLLGSPRLQFWAVKYRSKVARSLTHVWGKRLTGILRVILAKDGRTRTQKDKGILASNVLKHRGGQEEKYVMECVSFILGNRERLTLPMFKAFVEAREDLSKGKKLPMEVLEGLRGQFHKDMAKDDVLKLVAKGGKMSAGQKMATQKRAKAAGVEVKMDPTKYNAVKLYLYAFECGMTPEIISALNAKAQKAAAKFPAKYGTVGILVDASRSMVGHKTQKLRPMAATLAMRDMLMYVGETPHIRYCGGIMGASEPLVRPSGDTALADGLIGLLSEEKAPDVVFVLSDGYENAPAGRFGEVVTAVREVGIETPIYHLNPVMAAESKGVRELVPGKVPTLPAQDPAQLGTTVVRGLIEAEPVRGINVLLQMAVKAGPIEGRLLSDSQG